MAAVLLEHISFRYTAFGLRDVSLEVSPGEFFTIVGPNGSGKTTILKLIDGILAPNGGSLSLFGRALRRMSRQEVARIVAYVPQDGAAAFPFTVREVVLMGRSPHLGLLGFDSARDREIASWAMELAEVAAIADRPVTEISDGERQRVYVARALAQKPKILLLDEPHAHLDIAHQISLCESLRRLAAEQGLAVVAVVHDLNLASMFSDRMLLLHEGRAVAIGKVEEVLTPALINQTFHVPVMVDEHPTLHSPRVTLVLSHGSGGNGQGDHRG